MRSFLIGLFLAACAAGTSFAAIETPKGMPAPGSLVNAAPVACATLEDARKFTDLANNDQDKAREFVAEEGNTCGFAQGQFQVRIVEYVEYRGGAVIVKIAAPMLTGEAEIFAVYKVEAESLQKQSGSIQF